MSEDRCVEGNCPNPVVIQRDDGRCYYHGKVWDGLTERPPRLSKAYTDLRTEIGRAARAFAEDVRTGAFPDAEHSYS